MRPSIAVVAVMATLAVTLLACSGSTGSNPASSSGPASSRAPAAGAPTISGAWARPGAAGQGSAAYLEITGGSAADTLVSASSPGAAAMELHETTTDSTGMTGMRPIPSLAVPAGAAVALKPGSYHLMINGLKRSLAAGDTFEIDLMFQNAGRVVVQAEVKPG
jgi:copper(I)-binding protein